MSKTSRVTSRVIEDLRAKMQPISDKCHRDIIENEDVVGVKICENVAGVKCKVYAYPESKWRLGNCVMATHVETEAEKSKTKKRVGQQKQKKKSRK